VTSSSLAFFTERRINSLSQRLGNDRLSELVETIESIIRSRILAEGPSSISLVTFGKPSDIERVSVDKIRLYVDSMLPFILLSPLMYSPRSATILLFFVEKLMSRLPSLFLPTASDLPFPRSQTVRR
jgi:ABC-type siderophore export system fused ATPase/permease subunit